MKTLTKRYGTIGWQEFLQQKIDMLTEFDSVKSKTVNRPMKTEHGNAAEACFRSWLQDFLPKKFGVTSGYIIPDLRSASYTLRHYDVIVYDAVDSPVLWAESTLDKSELGKSRAIPAENVYSVFEVKSTLTTQSISEAKKKLLEINEFREYLNSNFTSAIIFFELTKKHQSKCKIGENLFNPNIFGYYGGVVFRAEEIDKNIAGYYMFAEFEETEEEMPLVREIGGLKIDDDGNPVLTKKGDYCEVVALENRWNFDKGYSPIIKNVHIRWSYNSFPHFAIDLIDRLNGKYSPTNQKGKNYYGMSYIRA